MAAKGAFAPEPRRRVNVHTPQAQEADGEAQEANAADDASRGSNGHVPSPRDDAADTQSRSPRTSATGTPERFQPVLSRQQDSQGDAGGSVFLGDFSVEEYTQAVVNGIHDAMGEVDLLTAGCALDQAMGEFLTIAQHAAGPKVAQEFGVRFCQTALPFAQLQLYTVKYKELAGKKR